MTDPQNLPPVEATGAVLVQSEDISKDAQKVEELDFNKIKGPVTADDLLQGMRHMGFQASSIAEAVRIINDMVSKHPPISAEAMRTCFCFSVQGHFSNHRFGVEGLGGS